MSDSAKATASGIKTAIKWLYWIVSIGILLSACYYLFNIVERPIAGILVFLGGVIAIYFYYVKWFVIPAARPEWPPYTTLCPDYLTPLIADAGGGKKKVSCVDFVGVSTNGRLRKSVPASAQNNTNRSDYAFTVDPSLSKEDLKVRTSEYGLSWTSMFGDR